MGEVPAHIRESRWILFDIIYYLITKLSPEEVVKAEVPKDLLANMMKADGTLRRGLHPSAVRRDTTAAVLKFLGDPTYKFQQENLTKARVLLYRPSVCLLSRFRRDSHAGSSQDQFCWCSLHDVSKDLSDMLR